MRGLAEVYLVHLRLLWAVPFLLVSIAESKSLCGHHSKDLSVRSVRILACGLFGTDSDWYCFVAAFDPLHDTAEEAQCIHPYFLLSSGWLSVQFIGEWVVIAMLVYTDMHKNICIIEILLGK